MSHRCFKTAQATINDIAFMPEGAGINISSILSDYNHFLGGVDQHDANSGVIVQNLPITLLKDESSSASGEFSDHCFTHAVSRAELVAPANESLMAHSLSQDAAAAKVRGTGIL